MVVTSDHIQQWFNILCRHFDGVLAAILIEPDKNNTLQITAKWPENLQDFEEFAPVIQHTLPKKAPVSVTGVQQTDNSTCDFFVQPVTLVDTAAFLLVKHQSLPKERHGEIFSHLQLSTQWLTLTSLGRGNNDRLYADALGLIASCIESKNYREALVSLATELTLSLDCEQVALSEFTNLHSKVVALSNSAKFDDRANFIQKIADAMDEAIDQDCHIAFPEPNASIIQRAHQELARRFGSGTLLTLPLVNNQTIIGAVTLLRTEEKPFDADSVKFAKLALALLAPYLALKKEEETALTAKIAGSLKHSLTNLVGFKHLKTKLAVGTVATLLTAGTLLQGEFQVTADAVLEGKMQRVVAAPIEGYLMSASVRAGDTVRKGDLMATLDDAELEVQQSKLNGQLQKYRREYREALSTNDLVKVRVISAQIDQANAEMELARQQIQKIALTAPFDSVVIEGDLSQQLGSPVKQGDMLFKIAPLEGYRIILKVDERLVSYVSPGQTGKLALTSLPEQGLNLKVEKITAIAKVDGNQNIFRVEASLENPPGLLRPGMEGIGKVNAGRRSYLWIWTHEIINWLRIWTWSWWL